MSESIGVDAKLDALLKAEDPLCDARDLAEIAFMAAGSLGEPAKGAFTTVLAELTRKLDQIQGAYDTYHGVTA